MSDLRQQHLHFVGIGGSGMSGLARLCRSHGASVTGSDRGGGGSVDALVAEGFEVSLDQTRGSVPPGTTALVISAAIAYDHPEVLEATRRKIEVVKYAAMLGRVMRQEGTHGIAVAGTHGKSSTTSMTAHVMIQAGLDPSVIVGANCAQIGGGWRASRRSSVVSGQQEPATGHGPLATGHFLLVEACEYDRSFHNYTPRHAAILNIEADHLDVYQSLDEVVESFAVFASKIERGGSLLIQHESPHRVAVTAKLKCKVETIGFAPQADWSVALQDSPPLGRGTRRFAGGGGGTAEAILVEQDPIGHDPRPLVTLSHLGQPVAQWRCPLPGDHMAYNSAVAAVLARYCGGEWDAITAALESFKGLDRRMQLLGVREGITVIDDYGHHPTEVDTTLRALRRHYKPSRLICVFQPHQHSRTRFLMDQFAVSFGSADVVIVPEIYFVRDSEQERMAVTAGHLVEKLRDKGVTAMHIHPLMAISEQLETMARDGDLVVTMGAGDVWRVAKEFLKEPRTQ